MNTKGYWKGKPIEEYSKEELIDIIIVLDTLYRKSLSRPGAK